MRWISDSKSIRKMEQKHNERRAELKELVDSLFEEEPTNSVEHLAMSGALRSALGPSALAGDLFDNRQALGASLGSQQALRSGGWQHTALQSQLAQNKSAAQQQPMQLGLGSLAGVGASLLGGSL